MPKPAKITDLKSGHTTAKKAAAILVAKNLGFTIPTAKQRQNLLVAYAKRGKVVYGRAFDIVRLSAVVDLDDLNDIERNLDEIVIFEIKSSRKKLRSDFAGYFFALTAAEVLVAQSLKNHCCPESQESLQFCVRKHQHVRAFGNESVRDLLSRQRGLSDLEYLLLNWPVAGQSRPMKF